METSTKGLMATLALQHEKYDDTNNFSLGVIISHARDAWDQDVEQQQQRIVPRVHELIRDSFPIAFNWMDFVTCREHPCGNITNVENSTYWNRVFETHKIRNMHHGVAPKFQRLFLAWRSDGRKIGISQLAQSTPSPNNGPTITSCGQ
jgi:hypothetical protein